MKTTLTVQESLELIKRRVSKYKASATYVGRWEHSSEGSFADPESVEPLFTLADLLSLLPKEIDGCNLTIGASKEEWRVAYELNELDENGDNFVITRTIMIQFAKELIDALFLALCNCLDNHVKLD